MNLVGGNVLCTYRVDPNALDRWGHRMFDPTTLDLLPFLGQPVPEEESFPPPAGGIQTRTATTGTASRCVVLGNEVLSVYHENGALA
ncbi:MAG: hypothetical protein ACF8Q5_00285, partial [Phycisphaerales bacterium JB040]